MNLEKFYNKIILVIETSDKCYQKLNLSRRLHEEDRLGGHNAYSVSKNRAKLVFNSYFNTILKKNKKLQKVKN